MMGKKKLVFCFILIALKAQEQQTVEYELVDNKLTRTDGKPLQISQQEQQQILSIINNYTPNTSTTSNQTRTIQQSSQQMSNQNSGLNQQNLTSQQFLNQIRSNNAQQSPPPTQQTFDPYTQQIFQQLRTQSQNQPQVQINDPGLLARNQQTFQQNQLQNQNQMRVVQQNNNQQRNLSFNQPVISVQRPVQNNVYQAVKYNGDLYYKIPLEHQQVTGQVELVDIDSILQRLRMN